MGLDVTIAFDGNNAIVNGDKALYTLELPFPPLIEQKTNPFRQYFTDDGLMTGSNDMSVDGSVVNQDFFIKANGDKDRYITNINFLVAYNSIGKPYLWADGFALANGSELFYSSVKGDQSIHDAIKTNQDLFRLGLQLIPTAWEIRHVNANNDYGYILSMDLKASGLPLGIKLDRGSSQRLTMRIKDNVGASADTFNCIAYGFERFE